MIIKGQKVAVTSGTTSSHARTSSLNSTSKVQHYPGLLKPNQAVKMAQIFDNSFVRGNDNSDLEDKNNIQTLTGGGIGNKSIFDAKNSNIHQHMKTEPTGATNGGYNPYQPIDNLDGNINTKFNNPINMPQLIQLNSSNNSILGVNNGGVNGIGPGGIEMNSFFSNSNGVEVQTSIQPQFLNNSNGSPAEEDHMAALGAVDSGMLQGILNQQELPPLLTNNQSMLPTHMDLSPDNTQYTILKAKLFNPKINDDSAQNGNNLTSKLLANNRSIFQDIVQSPTGSSGIQQRQSNLIHSQQFNLQQSNTLANQAIQQQQYQSTYSKQNAQTTKQQIYYQSQIGGSNTGKNYDLAKHLRHKKDMQQLKFYQTLTNQQQPNQSYQSTNLTNQNISMVSSSVMAGGNSQLNQSVTIGGGNVSNRKNTAIKYASQKPLSRGSGGVRTRSGKSGGTQGITNPYINIQSQFTFQDQAAKNLGTTGTHMNTNARPGTTNQNKVSQVINANKKVNDQDPYQTNSMNNTGEINGSNNNQITNEANDTFFNNNRPLARIGIAGGDNLQTNNDKSYTQLLSDGSRENYTLKSNLNSKDTMPEGNMNEVGATLNRPSEQSKRPVSKNQSMDYNNVNNDNSQNFGINQKETQQTVTNESNSSQMQQVTASGRKRQMISIEKVEKKRMLSESMDNKQGRDSSIMISNSDNPAKNQSMIMGVEETYQIIDRYQEQDQKAQEYQKQIAKQEISEDNLTQIQSVNSKQPLSNLIIKRCEFKTRPEPLAAKVQSYYSQQRNSLKNMRLLQSQKLKQAQQAYQGDNDQFKAESQLILKEQPNQEDKKEAKKDSHSACQRFLDRGNKPVPLKYEEHDVLPNIDITREYTGINGSRSHSKMKHYSRQIMHFNNNRQLLGGIGGTISGLNLDEFDEEINGINLSKLFSVYGPNSVENKKFQRKSTLPGEIRSGRSTSLNKTQGKGFEQIQSQNNTAGSDDEGSGNANNTFDNDEPIVIKLISNMFTKKKSVGERLLMLPNISVDKIKKEIQTLSKEEKAKKEKLVREQFLRDRQMVCEKLYQNFPQNKSYQEPQMTAYDQQQLERLRENPFYLALKANKDEREKIKQLRKMKRLEMENEQMRRQQEEELRRRAMEKDKTEIFAHTFVDYGDQEIEYQEQEYKGDIMNRPPKDVFQFMNLNFDLPVSYYQAFGDFNLPTNNQRMIIKNFMINHWSQMRNKKVTFKIAFDQIKQVFNVILLGKNCPLSKCCKMTVCFQFDREIGGKVICMETLCPYNPLDQFFMDIEVIEDLFSETERQPISEYMETNYDKGLKPRVQKALADEVSRSIQKGIYKNLSLRDVLIQKQSSTTNIKSRRRRKEIISQLYSSEALEENSQYNVLLDDEDEDQYGIYNDKTIQEEEEEILSQQQPMSQPNERMPGKIQSLSNNMILLQVQLLFALLLTSPIVYYYIKAASLDENVMGYFRAILAKKELSLRAFELTREVLKFNPGDYHAWALRRQIIDELNLPLDKEMEFLTEIGLHLEKNFQIWHHRRCIMEIYQKDFDKERDFLAEIFYSDKKNYHAWSYRLWFIERFKLWDQEEFDFVDEELIDEVTNNSLWSYRYFLIMKTQEFSVDLIRSEIQYALKKLELDYMNEAAWVYLRGLLATSEEEEKKSQDTNARRVFILNFKELKEHIHSLQDKDEKHKANRFMYMVLLDFAKAENDKKTQIELLEILKKIDRMRQNYYQWLINRLHQ